MHGVDPPAYVSFGPFGLTDKSAVDKAISRADNNLQKQLNTQQDSIPCPHCFKFQSQMVTDSKWAVLAGYGCLAVFLVVAGGVMATLTFASPPGTFSPTIGTIGEDLLALAGALLLVGFVSGLRYDPNRLPLHKRKEIAGRRASTEPIGF